MTTKTTTSTAAATPATTSSPFFSKESGQGSFGSATTDKFFSHKASHSIQAKLNVGQPGDHYEKEADSVADNVVQRLSEPGSSRLKLVDPVGPVTPFVQTKCTDCEKEEKLQKKQEDEKDLKRGKLQKKSIFESKEESLDGNVQRKCAACEKEEKDAGKKELQKKAIFESEEATNIQRNCAECEKKENLQKKSDSSGGQTASPVIENNLSSRKGSGSPLPLNMRKQMESSFGTDFSKVRIHNDDTAVQMSRDLNAQAFTHGSDIYFNAGKYDTGSPGGKYLLAHELTHVVQQNGKTQPAVNRKTESNASNSSRATSPFISSMAVSIPEGGLIQRDSTTPAPASGVTPPSPPPPGSKPIGSPAKPTEPDDGLVYITIPRWTVMDRKSKTVNLINDWSREIKLLTVPIPEIASTFDLVFKASLNAHFTAGIGPIVFTNLAIGMTKTTAAIVGASLAAFPFNPLSLPLAMRFGYFHGFGALDAPGDLSVRLGAECSLEGVVSALGTTKLDLAHGAFGLSGTIGAMLKGNARGMTDVVIDDGELTFSKAAVLSLEGNLDAAMSAYIEASILFGLFKARYNKQWSLINKNWAFSAWKPFGDMKLAYDFPSFKNPDKIITVREETIREVAEVVKNIMAQGDKPGSVDEKTIEGLEKVHADFDMNSTDHNLHLSQRGDKVFITYQSNPEDFIPALSAAIDEVSKRIITLKANKQFVEAKRLEQYKSDLSHILHAARNVESNIERDENQIVKGSKDTNAKAKLDEWTRQIAQLANFLKTASKGTGIHSLDEYFQAPPTQRYIPGGGQTARGRFIRLNLYENLHSWKSVRDEVEREEKPTLIERVHKAQLLQDNDAWDKLKADGLVEKNASIRQIEETKSYAYDPDKIEYAVDHKDSVANRWSKAGFNNPSDDERRAHFVERSNLRFITREFNSSKVSREDGNYTPFVGPDFMSRIAEGGHPGALKINSIPFEDAQGNPLSSIQKKEISNTPQTEKTKFVVEDGVATDANQMRKTDFLIKLNQDVCGAVDETLTGTPFSSQTCPYLSSAISRLKNKSVSQIETVLTRYEPRLLTASNVGQFFEILKEHVRTAATNWLQRGDLSGVPEEIAAQIPESMKTAATLAQRAGNFVSGVRTAAQQLATGTAGLAGNIGKLFFKPLAGYAKPIHSPASIGQRLGRGRGLESSSRGKMENAFDTSFSNVEIHTGGNSAQMAKDMNARAFTYGNHVVFGNNEYRPGTVTGDALLAHELAHVHQQKGNQATAMAKSNMGGDHALENEADDAAVGAVARIYGGKKGVFGDLSKKNMPSLKSGLQLQRCCGSGGPKEEPWDGNVKNLHIDIYETTTISEAPVDPGEAITRDYGSFAARLNYHEHSFPHVLAYHLYNSKGEEIDTRYPDDYRNLSRIMMPAEGKYTIWADIHPGPDIPGMYHLPRQLQVIKSYKDLSETQSKDELKKQAGHTLTGDLLNFEQFATVLRQNSVVAAGVPPDLIDSWNAANAQVTLVEAAIKGSIDPGLHANTKTALIGFYNKFRSIIGSYDIKMHHKQHCVKGDCDDEYDYYINKYLTQGQADAKIDELSGSGTSTEIWKNYLNSFYDVSSVLNSYVSDKLSDAGFKEAASQLKTVGLHSNSLRKLYRDHPDSKPVSAVFYPKLQADLKKNKDPKGPEYTLVALPQKMYTYRTDDGDWHLLDITRPDHPLETSKSGGTAKLPPRELLTSLDSPERFPEGILYWQFEGGAKDSCEMTHPWTASEVLNMISAVLALAGIVALVALSGGTAAPALIPTVCFIASGVVGAAGAAAHIHESAELGTLTTETIIVDSISIAANLLSAGAAGAGHIVKAAGAAETAWSGGKALVAMGAQTVYRPIQLGMLATDFASLVAFSAQAAEQYAQIKGMPPGDARSFAMQRLVGMSLLTGGMTLFSIKNGLHDVTSGRTLYLDYTTINGKPTAMAYRVLPEADMLAHTRLGTNRADAEAFLKRPPLEIDSATADQFRGELSIALTTPGISENEIQSFIQRMRTATQAEAKAILAEFRNNRIRVSVGGVSRSSGFDLTYFHTSPTDFQESVKQAFEGEGKVAHNGTLTHMEGTEISSYQLQVDAPNGTKVNADVTIVYQDFAAGSAIGTGTVAPGASRGPARNVVVWNAGEKKWTVRVEVDQHLAPKDIKRAVGHELDEASDVINRLHGNQGADVQQQIERLQKPGLLTAGGAMTSHDFATLREVNQLLAERATNPAAAEALSGLLTDMGLTGDRAQFQGKITKILASGLVDSDKLVLLEAWSTYDMAVARGSRIKNMSREDFIREYESGKRFDEGGTYRWYNVESERGNQRQFFTDSELADPNAAFDRLAGKSSTSSFKPYYEMLTDNGITSETKVRKKLGELLASPKGRDLDFVRHQLKEEFRDEVVSYLTSKQRLKTAFKGLTFEEASHKELLRITGDLNSSDKGSLAEEWYIHVYAPDAIAHVRVTGASGTTRYPDLIRPDGTLQDLKHIEGQLSPREIEQFDDYRRTIGSSVTIGADGNSPGSVVQVKRVRYAFLNPDGVEANAAWMNKTMKTSKGGITFEIFNSKGQRRIVTNLGVFEIDGTMVGGLELLTDTKQLNAWLHS